MIIFNIMHANINYFFSIAAVVAYYIKSRLKNKKYKFFSLLKKINIIWLLRT